MSGSSPVRSKEELLEILSRLREKNKLVALLVEFEARTGLRYSDASRLKFNQVMINGVARDHFSVVQSKAYNVRVKRGVKESVAKEKSKVIIHSNNSLKELIRQIYLTNGHNDLMFQSNHPKAKEGSPITSQFVNRMLKEVGVEMQLPYQLSTHSMRKSFTMMMIHAGASLNVIRDALGHSNAQITDNYISTFGGELKEVIDKIDF